MNLGRSFSLVFVAGLVYCLTVEAAPLSLAEAYQAALQKNESIGIGQKRVDQASELVDQAWGSLLPSVSLIGTYQRQDNSASGSAVAGGRFTLPEQTNAWFGLTQPIFRGMAEYGGLAAVKADRRAAEAVLSAERLRLYAGVADAYFKVLAAEQDRRNLQTLVDLSSRRVKELKDRSRIGRSREGDVLAARAQATILNSQLEAAQSDINQTRDQFSLVTGLAPHTPLAPADMANALPGKMEMLTAFLDRVPERPDLRAQQERVTSAEERVVVARAGHFPSLDATANYYLRRAGVLDDVKWDVGLRLTVPLFRGGSVSSQVSAALDLKKEQELLLAQTRRAAETEIRVAYERVRSGIAQILTMGEAAGLAEKNYKTQNRDYGLGLVTNLEVISAMDTFRETLRQLDSVRFQTLSAWAALQAAVGRVQ